MSVPYGFRDLFPVWPLSFTAATFSRPKPHGQHDRNDTSADNKEANEDRINAASLRCKNRRYIRRISSKRAVYGMR